MKYFHDKRNIEEFISFLYAMRERQAIFQDNQISIEKSSEIIANLKRNYLGNKV